MRSFRCKQCKTKRDTEMELIMFWISRFCSKSCRLDFTRTKSRKEKEKIKVRKVKKKEKKQNSISYLTKQADKLWASRIRDIWECEYCWKKEHLNAHHIIWRSNKKMRWDLENWISLCAYHHIFSSDFSAHKQPLLFTRWLEETKGTNYINNLLTQWSKVFKVTPEFLQNKIIELWKKENN